MPNLPTRNLIAAAHRRTPKRDRRIGLILRQIDAWSRRLTERLLGIVAAGHGGIEGVVGSTDAVLIGAMQEVSDILHDGLESLYLWAWDDVTWSWVDALPIWWWVRRLAPVKTLVGTEGLEYAGWGGVTEAFGDPGLQTDTLWQAILDGKATEAQARALVRAVEFGTPTEIEVEAVLNGSSANDGLSAMERIKTVSGPELDKARGAIRRAMSGQIPEGQASAVDQLAKDLRPLLNQNEGLNYKARRIARTEGVRVAEAAQRQSWEAVPDMIKGMRSWTAGDGNVRDSHRKWHNKLFLRTGPGEYRSVTLGPAPEFPLAPNCRGWSTPELHDELFSEVPGPSAQRFDAAMARLKRQMDDPTQRSP